MARVKDVVDSVYNSDTMEYYGTEATFLSGKDVIYRTGDVPTGATRYDKRRKNYHVTLGNKFFYDKYPKTSGAYLSDDDAYDLYRELCDLYAGLSQHEDGHIFFTDFKEFYRLQQVLNKKGLRYLCNVYAHIDNVIEDIYLEDRLNNGDFFAVNHIDTLNRFMFTDEDIEEGLDKYETEDSIEAVVSYLLMVAVRPDYEFTRVPVAWTKVKDKVEPLVAICLGTSKGMERTRSTLELTRQLIEYFDKPEADRESYQFSPDKVNDGFNEATMDNLPDVHSNGPGNDADGNPILDLILSALLQMYQQQSYSADSIKTSQMENSSGDTEDDGGITVTTEAQSTDLDEFNPASDTKVRAFSSMLAGENQIDNWNHHFDKLLNHSSPSHVTMERYNKVRNKLDPLIREVVESIELMKKKQHRRYTSGHIRGKKVKGSKLANPYNYRIMQQRVPMGRIPDPSFIFLIDTSGSMDETKRSIAMQSLIVFMEACNQLRIPTAAYYFNESSYYSKGSYKHNTIAIKEFSDSFEDTKGFISLLGAWNTHEPEGVKTYLSGGNVDEISLDYIFRKLNNHRVSKDKIYIVISDGATCGSKTELRDLSLRIEATGSSLFALGLLDDNVERIYNNHVVFKTNADLQRMPEVLADFLKENLMEQEK